MNSLTTEADPSLNLVGGQHHARTASELCTKGLWRLLTDTGESADNAARIIGRSPALLSEARNVAEALKARAAPAQDTEIFAILVDHAPVYGIRDLSPPEYERLFSVYLRALEPLPMEALREAFVDWSRTGSGFFPKPEQIYQRAERVASALRMAAYRAQKAVRWRDDHRPPKSAEERARDRQAAVDAGLIDENGRVVLNLRTTRTSTMVKETRSDMADRLRRVAETLKTENDEAI